MKIINKIIYCIQVNNSNDNNQCFCAKRFRLISADFKNDRISLARNLIHLRKCAVLWISKPSNAIDPHRVARDLFCLYSKCMVSSQFSLRSVIEWYTREKTGCKKHIVRRIFAAHGFCSRFSEFVNSYLSGANSAETVETKRSLCSPNSKYQHVSKDDVDKIVRRNPSTFIDASNRWKSMDSVS